MNFQQLRTFRQVVEAQSFTKAAERLNSTQSTVSMRISELEQHLGVQLLDRSKRQIRPTLKGQELLRYVKEMDRIENAIQENVGNPDKLSGGIRLGVTELIAVTWLPTLIAELKRHYPKIALELEVGVSGNILEKIESRDFDLLILPTSKDFSPGLIFEKLYEVEFRYFAHPSLGLSERTLSAKDLERCKVISPDRKSPVAMVQSRWFHQNKISPECISTSNSMEIGAILARSGFGAALLAYDHYKQEEKGGKLVALDIVEPIPFIPFFAVYSDEPLPVHVSKTIELVRDIASRLE
ncbi:LysR family transcriptional regulator [Aliishimia ponticola]|uniref:LysR family transcriptional regulator n=1 Tax=Aliishimia ponticola TaxID=2499833 RepID=A0A4S4N8I8_9RHOB|nr:LysR family transcriptional regulator [Aliishimia ponticola]THH34358.1 LysR family transcriptional regulator [Aliishimia ponticola]